MIKLQSFPCEVHDLIIEQLVIAIGIRKALLLRTVSRAFDAAILHAIVVRQAVDLYDPATPRLADRMCPALRGRIIAAKSRSATAMSAGVKSYVSVVSRVNQTLDGLIVEEDQELRRRRHEAIAGSVIPVRDVDPKADDDDDDWEEEILNMVGRDPPIDQVQMEAQNLLSGAVIAGNLPLVESLLQQHPNQRFPSSLAGVNGTTPYFPTLLSLAAK
ncbi:F-box domain and ankyrin repeat protein [Apiospora sp. TS-2023a]